MREIGGAPTPLRTLPPAGTEIPGLDLIRLLGSRARTVGARPVLDAIRAYVGVPYAAGVSQGRAALTLALELLRADSDKREVLVPAYTCYTVPASVARAGLRVRPIDILPSTLDFDPEALERADSSDAVAIVSTSLYGIPGDLRRLEAFAARRGIAMVDDAAQALGARLGDRPAGTFGRVGFFSLSRGKSITTWEGGLLVTKDAELAARLEARIQSLPDGSSFERAKSLLGLLALSLFLHPRLYGLPSRVLRLGESTFDPGFPIQRYPDSLSRLGAWSVSRLDEINGARRAKAEALRAMLPRDDRLQIPEAPAGSHPIYVRFPILLEDEELRGRTFRKLRRLGLGPSLSYPEPVHRIPGIQPHLAAGISCSSGERVARAILTLPTHAFVTDHDLQKIAETLRDCLKGRG